MPKKKKVRYLVFGVIGAGIAVAIAMIVMVILFLIQPSTTSSTLPQATTSTTTSPQQQQQPVNNNTSDDDAFTTPEERLRQEDPAFDKFKPHLTAGVELVRTFTLRSENMLLARWKHMS